MSLLEEVVRGDEGNSRAQLASAGIYAHLHFNERAITQLEVVIKAQPTLLPAIEQLGGLYYNQGNLARDGAARSGSCVVGRAMSRVVRRNLSRRVK